MENSKKRLKSSASLTTITKGDPNSTGNALQHALEEFLCEHLKIQSAKSDDVRPLLLIALSGGLDSVVLLHLLASARSTVPFDLHAMHVHHGLSPNADAWADFCLRQCQHLQVPLRIVHVHVAQLPDNINSEQGIEAEARALRYSALFNYRASARLPAFIVTAHHQDDQAETLLLQLFRGGGVKGLASMAAADVARRLLRPLLGVTRQSLLEYAMQRNIKWCDDESNDNTRYDRNFVRHIVMPVLESRYPSIKAVLGRTAAHMAEASELLEVLAAQDAMPLIAEEDSICLQGLAQLSLARCKNVLRWWFFSHGLAMPAADHLHEIVEQLLFSKKDAALNIKLQHLYLRKHRQRGYLCADKNTEPFDMVWNGEAELMLPNGGKLIFRPTTGHGLAIGMGMSKLRICCREGGERFKPDAHRPTRTLKYLLQQVNIPPWQRQYLPLIYWDDKLAFVPGIGAAHELQAKHDEPGIEIVWQDT